MTDDVMSGNWSFRDTADQNLKRWGYRLSEKSDGHPVRSGEKSIRFEVRSGDCSWDKYHSNNDCKRSMERREKKQDPAIEHGNTWYHWSLYIPENSVSEGYPILGQFHYATARGGWGAIMFFRVAAVRILGTKEYVEAYAIDPLGFWNAGRDTRLVAFDDMKGKWTDVLVNANWSHNEDGFIRVYVNGSEDPIYSYSGSTRKSRQGIEFKFGIYRFTSKATHVVYYDDVRKGKSCSEVTQYFPCDKIVNATDGS